MDLSINAPSDIQLSCSFIFYISLTDPNRLAFFRLAQHGRYTSVRPGRPWAGRHVHVKRNGFRVSVANGCALGSAPVRSLRRCRAMATLRVKANRINGSVIFRANPAVGADVSVRPGIPGPFLASGCTLTSVQHRRRSAARGRGISAWTTFTRPNRYPPRPVRHREWCHNSFPVPALRPTSAFHPLPLTACLGSPRDSHWHKSARNGRPPTSRQRPVTDLMRTPTPKGALLASTAKLSVTPTMGPSPLNAQGESH